MFFSSDLAARPIVWLLPYSFDGEILRSGVHLARYRVEMFFLEPTKIDNTTDQKFTAIWADMEQLAIEFISRLNIYLETLPRGGRVERYTIAQAPPEQLFDAMLTGVNVTINIETELDVNYCRPFYDSDGFPYTLPLTFSA